MTSNVGTKVVQDFGGGVGFSTTTKIEKKDDEVKSLLEKELFKRFAPEFINRFDEIIYFKDLNENDLLKIVASTYEKDIEIIESNQLVIDRSLSPTKFFSHTNYSPPMWDEQIYQMKLNGDQIIKLN